MKCFYCKSHTRHLQEKTHEERRQELAKIRSLPHLQNMDPVSDVKVKKAVREIRQIYCERCTYEQIGHMNAQQIERMLRQIEI